MMLVKNSRFLEEEVGNPTFCHCSGTTEGDVCLGGQLLSE